jgi:hypothetical protein
MSGSLPAIRTFDLPLLMTPPMITDEYMREMLAKSRDYVVVILYASGKRPPGADEIVWEHGRRNFQLRAEGRLAIVCPVRDDTTVSGVGIFTGNMEEVRAIMDGDPGVQAGIFTYELHPCRSFPGDALP